MPGRLAIDFGTSSTLVALWDESQNDALPLILPEYSRTVAVTGAQGEFGEVPIIPSIIHYGEDESERWIGQQVFEKELYEDPKTFRWMKRFISRRTPLSIRAGLHEISAVDAGRDFLSSIISVAANGIGVDPVEEDIALTVPVEAFEHYDQWLVSVAETCGLNRVQLIDEATAAAIGYGTQVQPGEVYAIFDFGGGSLDVSVVLAEEPIHGMSRRCRVLGKAGTDLGGATIDEWLFRDVLRQSGLPTDDENVRRLSRKLLIDCERAKEQLSLSEKTDVSVLDIYSGFMLSAEYTQAHLEQMLTEQGLFTRIEATLRRALAAAEDRGYPEDQIKAVFMIGGSSLIPSVQQALTRLFGGDRVMIDRPLDAVACGASAFIAGVELSDHIQHDYAIRYVNRRAGVYDFRPIVRRGTTYPTHEPVAKILVKASHAGQTRLGISVFEMGPAAHGDSHEVELVFDVDGTAHAQAVSAEDHEARSRFWINEATPAFLSADTHDARFEVHFGIDARKRLILSAKNIATGNFVYEDVAVATLQ